ncbi:DUF4328 domain-containing protein [Pseudonocardia parietis]|uniref:DUF4328 domain-containing protein n=1 Tax=Pseudonocardia parietis TaxID=570936 RepID=A0ABS4VLC2_9PSEU|nr:DUF4328 domain-containing protein [Pseudonocardia parietis]MBP2364717.1 hypothetical protein [Pseudonocardia parietis]
MPHGSTGLPPCPRCGRQAAPGSGVFCPWCGRYLAAMEWVATPPETTRPRPAAVPAQRYTGPPRYRSVPRWGLPVGPWRAPSDAGDGPVPPLERARWLAGQLIPVLWVTVVVSAVAAVAEVWRYGLLLASRSDALSPVAVGWSDAMVWFGGWSSIAAVIAAGVLTISWSLWAYRAAADRSGTRPWRSRRRVVAGWLVPGWNLVAPGSLLAETEHAALELPVHRRPSPSRGLLVWWALWGASVLLAALALVWRFRSGTQALADGVVLHAWAGLLAAVTAYRTIRLVRWITALLEPDPRSPRELLVRPAAGGVTAASPTAKPPAPATTAPEAPTG